MRILRRGELATGQRWNFRDAFSLAAELLVGEWGDFEGSSHPCEWVHKRAGALRAETRSIGAIVASTELMARLYPHSLFAATTNNTLLAEVASYATQRQLIITAGLAEMWGERPATPNTHIRWVLANVVSPALDPLKLSPHRADHPVAQIEDAFSQSVAAGRSTWPSLAPPALAEAIHIELVEAAEKEWDLLGRDSAQVAKALGVLRSQSSIFTKRSVSTRLGMHANEDELGRYEQSIRNQDLLDSFKEILRSMLGQGQFRFNALETFGQPQSDRAEREGLVYLEGPMVPIAPITPAPYPVWNLPAHDFPFIEVHGFPVPLTFDLFSALILREQGCASSSLPPSVRAALDRIRQLYAGNLARNLDKFVYESAAFVVRGQGRIVLDNLKSSPRFSQGVR
jgi:hypothetical protein